MERPRAILLTQCLQNDFVQLLDKFDPLPNSLHVGYAESRRLLGERVEDGPVHAVMHWAYHQVRPEDLTVVHIRDWHDARDPSQADHLRQFGEHCVRGSRGAEFVFKNEISDESRHRVVNASGLNDFAGTDLADVLRPYVGAKPVRVGLMGVWTEAKISFLAYELRTRYPNFDLAVCSALTASSSRSMHFVALDQLRNILGLRVFSSVGGFTDFLAGSSPAVTRRAHNRLDDSSLSVRAERPLSDPDRSILRYLFRDCATAEFESLDGGFSGNVVLRARAVDRLGHRQVPTVVKIGERDAIAEERTAFERIQEVLGNNAPNIVDFAEVGERGGIKYRYASMVEGKVQVFQDLYAASDDLEHLGRFLHTVFGKQLGRLYEAAVPEKLDLLEYYDFQSRYAPGVRRRVEAIIGGPAAGPTLQLTENLEISNPCLFYEQDLSELSEYHAAGHFMSYVHGDLNGRNIVVDEQENIWLIDFFHTHKGHVLKDFLKLENDLLYIMTAIENEEQLEEACTMSRILIDWKDLGTPPDPDDADQFKHPQLQKAWRTVALLRSYYPELIQSDRAPYQMHVGLMRYAMHTMSFEESSPLQRKWALFSGALCADLIRGFVTRARRLRVDFLQVQGRAGRIGLTILPGRKDRGRDLNEDLAALQEDGVSHVLCLITEDEFREYGVSDLKEGYAASGLHVRYFPILDQSVPGTTPLEEVLDWMETVLADGGTLMLHCVGGLGRSGTVAAAYLSVKNGMDPGEAVAVVRQARGERAVETSEQEGFVHALAGLRP